MASESKADPHLGLHTRFEQPQEPTPVRPIVPMRLPSADAVPADDFPADDPEPEFPAFPRIPILPREEITKQMQLLC
jgi:hypothetical protein